MHEHVYRAVIVEGVNAADYRHNLLISDCRIESPEGCRGVSIEGSEAGPER